jgi:uroporphyrinogen-III synthase
MKGLPLIVVRPEPGCAATMVAARALNLDAHGFPLFDVAGHDWHVPDPALYDGLLAGSANVFRHGGPGLAALTGLPVHAVGDATAQAAREAGFNVAEVGSGGLQPLVSHLLPSRMLRLCGHERVTLTCPDGITVDDRVVYAARAKPLPDTLVALLQGPAVVALHSGEAARHFKSESDRLNLPRHAINLACLAPRIAESAGSGWHHIEIAVETTDAALLELACQMCQTVCLRGHGQNEK